MTNQLCARIFVLPNAMKRAGKAKKVMPIARKYKISAVSETRFKEWRKERLCHRLTTDTERYVIRRIDGEMNTFYQIEKDYRPTIDGWRSYPTLTKTEAEVAQKLVVEFGAKWHGEFDN